MIETSVVIPVYGSEKIIPQLLEQLSRELESAFGADGFEVVLVHDCGPDDSWRIIKTAAQTKPWLRGVNLRKNAGQHNAIMAGLAIAQGRYIVTMDDDLQHSPADIVRLVDSLRSGVDVCYAQFQERHHALWKIAGSKFNDLVAQFLLKKPKGLYLSPFRAITAEVRDEIVAYRGPYVYLDGLILQATNNISTVVVGHHLREDGRSGYSLYKSISLWLKMATSFSVVPLRTMSLLGVVVSIGAFLLAALVIVQRMSHPEMAMGWASLIVTILFAGGVQLIALGMIGEYVGRILLTLNGKPQYVIRNVVGGGQAEVPDDSQ